MAKIEQYEMDAHSAQLTTDVIGLVEKYRAIFGWDVPDIDEALADRLIIGAIRRALDELAARAPTVPAR